MKIVYQIRKTIYRNEPGFLVLSLGKGHMFNTRIFAQSRPIAEHILEVVKSGKTITTADFQEVQS